MKIENLLIGEWNNLFRSNFLKSLIFTLGAIFSLVGLAQQASAIPITQFNRSLVESLQAKGEVVLLHFCQRSNESCQSQFSVLGGVLDEVRYYSVHGIIVPIDDPELLKKYKVREINTYILFSGDQEIGRQNGSVNTEVLRAFLDKAFVRQ